jgi:hypothetical protein
MSRYTHFTKLKHLIFLNGGSIFFGYNCLNWKGPQTHLVAKYFKVFSKCYGLLTKCTLTYFDVSGSNKYQNWFTYVDNKESDGAG